MRIRTRKLLVVACIFAAGLFTPGLARAGIFADAWSALFSPAGTPYFPSAYATYYAGSGYGYPARYSAYYAGGYCRPVRVYYPPADCCRPCDPCSNPCAAGAPCQISDGGGSPKTFKRPQGGPPTPMKDDNFKSRDESGKKTFKSTREEEKEKPPFGSPGKSKDGADGDNSGAGSGPIKREALKPPVPPLKKKGDGANGQGEKSEAGKKKPAPVIRKKKPAPAKPAVGPGKSEKTEQAAVVRVEGIDLDGTIRWRTPLRRTRLVIRPVLPSPSVARVTVPLNQGWRPVRKAGTKLVRK